MDIHHIIYLTVYFVTIILMFKYSLKYGIILLGIIVPIHTVSIYLFNFITFEISTILALTITFLWSTKMILSGRIVYRRTYLDKYLFLLILIYLISSLFAYNKLISWRGISAILLNNLLIYFLIVNIVKNEHIFKQVLIGTFIGAIIVSSYAIYQSLWTYFNYEPRWTFLEWSNNPYMSYGVAYYTEFLSNNLRQVFTRPRSTLGTSNILAGYLLTPLLMLISISFYYFNRKKLFYLILIFISLIFYSYLHTFSRAGLGGLFISLIFFTFLNKNILFNKKILKTLFFITLTLIIFGTLVSFPFKNVLGRIFEPSGIFITTGDEHNFTSSTYAHQTLAKCAINMFLSNPLLGVGYNNYGTAFAIMFDPSMYYMVAHSQYLGILAETGLLGILINLLIFYKIIKYTYKTILITENTFLKYILKGLLSAYIGILASNIVGEFYNYQFVWFFIGLMMSANIIARNNNLQSSKIS